MAPDKIYLSVDRTGDWKYALWSIEIPTPQERELNELDKHEEYIRKDALVDKLYKWMDKDTTVTDYYSKEDFKKVIDNLF